MGIPLMEVPLNFIGTSLRGRRIKPPADRASRSFLALSRFFSPNSPPSPLYACHAGYIGTGFGFAYVSCIFSHCISWFLEVHLSHRMFCRRCLVVGWCRFGSVSVFLLRTFCCTWSKWSIGCIRH